MKRYVYIVWGAGLLVTVIIWWIIWSNAKHLSSDLLNTLPNRVRSYGIGNYVTDIRIGWCNNDGHIIDRNLFTDSLTVTIFLQNFDGWLLRHARVDQRLLPEDLKPEELKNYLSLVELRKSSPLSAEQNTAFQTLQTKINHWILHERSNLRLMIAGQVFETIPPFDATAAPTYGSGEFEGETYNRIVFHLAAPDDPTELQKWRTIIRAAGPTCDAQISLARPIVGAADALRMPTLVNADAIYTTGAKPVYRSLPLVPPFRQGAATTAVVFTICAVLAAAFGTSALHNARGANLTADQQAPWSLSRVVFAWWLTICVGCFAYLWALMGEYRNILSGSAPILLGLQGATLLIATGFGRIQDDRASQGFFADLISEGGEPEIARLQMLVWNFILGIVFIWQSVFQWTMPTFDPMLMTLLGISSATYVGFKFVPKTASSS
ncbi:MAG TPA: hypothetical protein VGM65_13935 [Candidatus Udaeobacter sp.]